MERRLNVCAGLLEKICGSDFGFKQKQIPAAWIGEDRQKVFLVIFFLIESKTDAYLVGRCDEREATGLIDMQIRQNALAFVHLDVFELVGRGWARNENL